MSKSIIETPLLYFYLSTKKGEKKNNGEMYEKKEKVLLNSQKVLARRSGFDLRNRTKAKTSLI